MFRNILYYLSTMLYFLGLAHIVPLIFSIIVGEKESFIFAILIDIGLLLFLGYLFRKISIVGEIGLVEAYMVMVLSFIIPAFTCAFPIMMYGYSFIDSLFEGVSSITTTGLSVLDYGELSIGIEFLRAYYQWLGGIGVALLVVSFMIAPGSAAYNIYLAHLGKYKITPLSSRTIRIILSIYVSLTIVYVIVYLVSGLSLVDSIINALTTISTGGFSRLSFFSGVPMYSAVALMFISAQPLALFYFIRKGNVKKILSDPQLISFATIVFIGSISLYFFDRINYSSALFQTVSALSTTGYTSVDNKLLSDASKLLLSTIMILGAGFGSTGGGIKQLRIVIIGKTIIYYIKKQLLPKDAVLSLKISGKQISWDEVLFSFILLAIYILVLLVSTIIISAQGYSLQDSLFESASALATTGLSTGLSSHTLPLLAKTVLIIDMWFGRVEIIPYLILFGKLFQAGARH